MAKRSFYQIHNIHPNTPRRLVKELHSAKWNRRELARMLDVNSFYVTALLKDGQEPTDQTANGQAIRVKLFLPRLKPKPRKRAEPSPPWLKHIKRKIAGMAKETRERIFQK